MANLFAITAASDTVVLDPLNQAETTFTVRNLSETPVHSRASLRAQNPAAASWLMLLGETERLLPVAATAQYPARISVPLGAPAGTYAFHLEMLDLNNPDESLTQGPPVTFSVPPARLERPRFLRWVVLLLVGILLLLLIAYAILHLIPR